VEFHATGHAVPDVAVGVVVGVVGGFTVVGFDVPGAVAGGFTGVPVAVVLGVMVVAPGATVVLDVTVVVGFAVEGGVAPANRAVYRVKSQSDWLTPLQLLDVTPLLVGQATSRLADQNVYRLRPCSVA
jgi:hypothetical protein